MSAQRFATPRPDEGGRELQAFLVGAAGKVASLRPLKSATAGRNGQALRVNIHDQRFLTRLTQGKAVSLKQELKDLFDLLKLFPLQNMQRAIDGTLTGKSQQGPGLGQRRV